MTEKITRATALTTAIEMFRAQDMTEHVEVLEKMLASITKRSTAPKTDSKTRRENMALLAEVMDIMDPEEGYAAGSFVGRIQFVTTPQKATAILRLGVSEGLIKCEKEGKVNKYYLV